MASINTRRRLAAILAADVVGYSRLMSENEERTLRVLKQCLHIFQKFIPQYEGRIFGGAGDSIVAEFPSAVAAVSAAVAIQQELASRNSEVAVEEIMQFRIGISVGDVVIEGDNLMGEGVNIAARLESLAEPGGINITGYVYHQVNNKVSVEFEDAGKQMLKNIPNPIQIYRVLSEMSVSSLPMVTKRSDAGRFTARRWGLLAGFVALIVSVFWFLAQQSSSPVQSEKPSVVVLPFGNISGDREQEYFVDGITEDIITDISRLSNLTVIAWSTSANFKGKKVNPLDVGKALGVDYVLDGSVRKVGDRVRITAKLVDAENGNHVWAERYDRELVEVFALQDEVTNKIVNSLAVKLTPSEKEMLERKGSDNIAAYDSFLRGQQYATQRTKEGNILARDAFHRAIELDPGHARSYGALAVLLTRDYRNGWTELSLEEARARARELVQKAVALDKTSPQVYWASGYVNLLQGRYDEAAEAARQAVLLAPSYADGYGLLAFINNSQGEAEDALRNIRKAMVLNPYYTYEYPSNLGRAYYTLGRYAEAVESLTDAIQRNENTLHTRLYLAASYVGLGRQEDAEWEIRQTEILHPGTTLSLLANTLPIKDKLQLNSFLENLRKAGLPQ